MGLLQNMATNSRVLVVSAVTIASVSAIACLLHRYVKRYLYWNSPWVRVGVVERLYFYPVKSCKGKNVPWLECEERGGLFGGLHDRYFMAVDALHEHRFLTARTYPRMVLIEPLVDADNDGEVLTLRFPREGEGDGNDGEGSSAEVVSVNLKEVLERADVRRGILHFNTTTDGYDCGDEMASALTTFLQLEGKRDVRLLYFSPHLHTERDISTNSVYWSNNPVPRLKQRKGYADTGSFTAVCHSTIDDLNSRLAAKGVESVSERNFRPIVLISGPPAYDEDRWLGVKIVHHDSDQHAEHKNRSEDSTGGGDGSEVGTEFICYKPCVRCVLTTVNPDTGEKHPEMEPLRELRSYRLAPEGSPQREFFQESPMFCVNMALVRRGRIAVGDSVWVQYKPTSL